MIGVGRIYEMYRTGKLERDDEVALLFDSDTGRAVTEPLVNVRFAAARLISEGTIDAERGHAIIDAASRLHFRDRVYRNILREAGIASLENSAALIGALKAIDLKREDAQTLLERFEELSHAASTHTRASVECRDEYDDHFDSVRVRRKARADHPVLIWESGEQIEFRGLVRFLALTGRLEDCARRALARFLLDDGSVKRPRRRPRVQIPTVQELFESIADEWGWSSTEEHHVTLDDLGLGRSDLESHLREEHEGRLRVASLIEKLPAQFLRALRYELFSRDLSLKREAMRLGALEYLAVESSPVATTLEERDDAKRALLCSRPDLTWEGLLAEGCVSAEEASPVVELLARARRSGASLLEETEAAPAREGIDGVGVGALPKATRSAGASRSIPDEEAMRAAVEIGARIGVTRIAQLGELERFGLHVAAAYRATPVAKNKPLRGCPRAPEP